MQNLFLRFISSIFLFIIFLCLVSENEILFIITIQLLLILSLWEYTRLLRFKTNVLEKNHHFLSRERISFLDSFNIFVICFLILFIYTSNNILLNLVSVSLVFSSLLIIYRDEPDFIFGIIYISIPFFLLVDLRFNENYFKLITFIVLFSVLTDVSCYVCGKLIGGIKLAPSISPGKTISGSLGGITIPCMFSLIFFGNVGNNLTIIISSVIFSFSVQIGDLLESYFKRKCYVKDSSNLIPGHGGLLDRFDGVFILVIIIYLLELLDFNFFFIV